MDKKTRKNELIKQFQHKACCSHTQQKANRIWEELKLLLTEDEKYALFIAWDHHRIGEGREEFDIVCKGILNGESNSYYRHGT